MILFFYAYVQERASTGKYLHTKNVDQIAKSMGALTLTKARYKTTSNLNLRDYNCQTKTFDDIIDPKGRLQKAIALISFYTI